jgi:hypothetical protein
MIDELSWFRHFIAIAPSQRRFGRNKALQAVLGGASQGGTLSNRREQAVVSSRRNPSCFRMIEVDKMARSMRHFSSFDDHS